MSSKPHLWAQTLPSFDRSTNSGSTEKLYGNTCCKTCLGIHCQSRSLWPWITPRGPEASEVTLAAQTFGRHGLLPGQAVISVCENLCTYYASIGFESAHSYVYEGVEHCGLRANEARFNSGHLVEYVAVNIWCRHFVTSKSSKPSCCAHSCPKTS
jgi:hypothetical protein